MREKIATAKPAPLTTPITQTSVFVVPGLAELRRYAEGDRDIYLYARYSTPTVKAAEDKIAALEGAEAAVITSSGMSAILVAALATLQGGRRDSVSMLDIYGGTVKLFENVLCRCGIKSRFIPYSDLGKAERYFTRKTRMLFLETPTNPTLRCADIAALPPSRIDIRRASWSTTRSQRRFCRSRSNSARTS